MKTRALVFAALAVCQTALLADEKIDALKKEAVANYAAIAGHAAADAYAQAVALQKAVKAFTSAPSAETHQAAKDAWIAARLPYLQSEVFRVADESAGALDGAPVDYVKDIGMKAGGFHSIEFILWGEDDSVDGPGDRSHEDFVLAKNDKALRHASYLNASTALVAKTLAATAADWKEGNKENARGKFEAQSVDAALGAILASVTQLAGELRQERLGKPYDSRKQEDESSNYSDTTHLDLIYGCSGIANVVAGAYVGIDTQAKVQGNGLLQLAAALDEERGKKLKLAINRVMFAVTDFRPPFDRALLAPDDSPAREDLKEIMDALDGLIAKTAALATALGLEPEPAEEKPPVPE